MTPPALNCPRTSSHTPPRSRRAGCACAWLLSPPDRVRPTGEHRRCRAQDVKRNHAKLLRANQHLRYMWIPHTDRVVVVTNNPHRVGRAPPRVRASYTDAERLAPLRTLLKVRVEVEVRAMWSFQLRVWPLLHVASMSNA